MQAQAAKKVVDIVKGSILEAQEKYIVHQTNCVSKEAFGLSQEMFKKFPHANCYAGRVAASKPGTIEIKGNGTTERYVINLFGQRTEIPPMMPYQMDNWGLRFFWFSQGLDKIYKIKDLQSVAFNYRIGCGLGGGRWADYFEKINYFAGKNPQVQTKIYQLPDETAYNKIISEKFAEWSAKPKQYISHFQHY